HGCVLGIALPFQCRVLTTTFPEANPFQGLSTPNLPVAPTCCAKLACVGRDLTSRHAKLMTETIANESSLTFSDFGLHPDILKAVADTGYTPPPPIQSQALPAVMDGRDVMGAAQTGTGKTAAFTLPILHRLLPHANTS